MHRRAEMMGTDIAAPQADVGHGDTAACPLNCGFGVTIGQRRYYLHVRAGVERRSPQRLAHEGQARVPFAALLYGLGGAVFLVAFGLICFLYIVKSLLGIDLFEGNSPLHMLYAALME